jgi:hypothetical protein
MNIHGFAAALISQIKRQAPQGALETEAFFERQHVIEPAWALAQVHPEIHVAVHPAETRRRCKGRCDHGVLELALRAKGCPKCWSASKQWSVVEAFSTRNNFDLVAMDRDRKTLAVEVKWLSLSSARGPNGEFQRFIGQCTLAAAIHDVVIGVCGFRGSRKRQFDRHDAELKATLKKIGVVIIPLNAQA